MLTLLFDTSTSVCTVSISKNNDLLCTVNNLTKITHTEQLWLSIDSLFKQFNLNKSEISEIVVGSGPGSWTGLRIGISSAKSIALSLNAELYSLSTLDILANKIKDDNRWIISVIDAKKGEVYFCIYTNRSDGLLKRRSKYLIDTPQNLIGYIKNETILIGNGAYIYRDFILNNCNEKVFIDINSEFHQVNSNELFYLHQAKLTKKVDIKTFEPLYIRKPEAEQKLDNQKIYF